MSRIIATERPGKLRHQFRRTIAEAMRRLSQKQQLDNEAKDLAALIVFCLHGITDTVEQTIAAWEKRNYWMKAEHFRQEWRWLERATDDLSSTIYQGKWEEIPATLAELMPHFADIKVKKLTRSSSLWEGAYDRFMQEG
jgi:hypothetical protein